MYMSDIIDKIRPLIDRLAGYPQKPGDELGAAGMREVAREAREYLNMATTPVTPRLIAGPAVIERMALLLYPYKGPADETAERRHKAAIINAIGGNAEVFNNDLMTILSTCKPVNMDVAGNPKLEATLLEKHAIDTLNLVKAWRGAGPGVPFPVDIDMMIDTTLLTYEARRRG